jgi:hypothetical protein
MAVPRKKAGSYVNCPSCGGRLWVPEDMPKQLSDSAVIPIAVPPVATPPSASPPGARQPPDNTISMRDTPLGTPPPTAPDTPRADPRKVARFVTADAAQSTLKPAEDGKLPELHLNEGRKPESKQARSKTIHPLILLGVLVMSVALSVLLVVVDTESRSTSTDAKAAARIRIQDHYFTGYGNQSIEPYQQYLREAQRAHSRGDFRAERRLYRKVFDLLRAERGTFEKGLTGSRGRDDELKRLISILLRS